MEEKTFLQWLHTLKKEKVKGVPSPGPDVVYMHGVRSKEHYSICNQLLFGLTFRIKTEKVVNKFWRVIL